MNSIGIRFLFENPVLLALFVGFILFLVVFERTRRAPKAVPEQGGQDAVMRSAAPQDPALAAPNIAATQAPWASRLFTHLDIIHGYGPTTTPDDPKELRAFAARAMMGKRPDPLPCLQRTKRISGKARPIKDISIATGGLLLVSERMKQLLQDANGDTCAFYPTRVYDGREKNLLSDAHSYWAIGARKNTLQIDETPGLKPVTINEASSAYGTFHPPEIITDGQICLSADCLDGPQVWVEARLRSTVFFSDAFVQELRRNKLAHLFGLKRCTIGS